MDERSGTEHLSRIFKARGLDLQREVPFAELGPRLVLDGFDPARRIGFELITTEAGDRESFTPEIIEQLEERMARGELYQLLIDEVEANEVDALTAAAEGFLDQLRRMGKLP